MSESLTTKQVAEHNTVENGLYIIIDGSVYKMDTFVDEHPGGAKILKRVGGKDASKQFWKVCSTVLSFNRGLGRYTEGVSCCIEGYRYCRVIIGRVERGGGSLERSNDELTMCV